MVTKHYGLMSGANRAQCSCQGCHLSQTYSLNTQERDARIQRPRTEGCWPRRLSSSPAISVLPIPHLNMPPSVQNMISASTRKKEPRLPRKKRGFSTHCPRPGTESSRTWGFNHPQGDLHLFSEANHEKLLRERCPKQAISH